MAFMDKYDEKMDSAIAKATGKGKPESKGKPEDKPEAKEEKREPFIPAEKKEPHGDVSVEELYKVATPEERALIEKLCERIDSPAGGPPAL